MINYSNSLKNKLNLLIIFTAIIISVFVTAFLSSLYYYSGIERLFSEEVRNKIEETNTIANLYLEEHINSIKVDSLVIQGTIERSPDLINNYEKLKKILDEISQNRALSEIVIFSSDRKNIATSSYSLAFLFDRVPEEYLDKTEGQKIHVYRNGEDKVQALSRIYSPLSDKKIYLLVGRYLDESIMNKIRDSNTSTNLYSTTEKKLRVLKKPIISIFAIGYIIFFFIIILIARRISHLFIIPIQNLVSTASRIKDGEYGLIVPEEQKEIEIMQLSNAFNQMSISIANRKKELELALDLLDQRNNFIESILEEITIGVIVFDSQKNVILINDTAKKILDFNEKKDNLNNYKSFFPELENIIDDITNLSIKNFNNNTIVRKIRIIRKLEYIEILIHIRLIPDNQHSIIVTLDNITKISAAERLRAWADVAQKVTHEIKNPLTPIQLAVERLEKKFSPEDRQDRNQFLRYTQIILERVSDIQSLIKEFITFSRIAPSRIESCNIIEIINNVILLEQNSNKNIKYEFDNRIANCYVLCDRMQITQVLINILKNAAEAIYFNQNNLYKSLSKDKEYSTVNNNYTINNGLISISLSYEYLDNCDYKNNYLDDITNDLVFISIQDNGGGLKSEPIEGISTKIDGSGIGLAIVKKILQGHEESMFEIKNTKDNSGSVAIFALKKVKSNMKS
ncbi:sensor histidine kinase [Lyticum sinuosum]|uniref:histidine kinase n=1 Tax=Lyticum sinuosum TaxID=1332059 RepID=A0AAE5AHS0_9RICK|nr:histidine kinase dimerization/phospho-acceptor domain-containing protein [Lyticum sinuosum]MDZ5761311.1 PAS domain-containing sensor histidine kinase [Lyticum sinuosum]